MINEDLLLFIEPKNPPSKKPLIDSLTKKMTASFRKGKRGVEKVGNSEEIVKSFNEFKKMMIKTHEKLKELVINKKIDETIMKKHKENKSEIIIINDNLCFETDTGYRGFYTCSCGRSSDCCNFLLKNNEITNSLCIHYLAYH